MANSAGAMHLSAFFNPGFSASNYLTFHYNLTTNQYRI